MADQHDMRHPIKVEKLPSSMPPSFDERHLPSSKEADYDDARNARSHWSRAGLSLVSRVGYFVVGVSIGVYLALGFWWATRAWVILVGGLVIAVFVPSVVVFAMSGRPRPKWWTVLKANGRRRP
ncbi:MAG: hypothetical protein OXE87_16685 [Chloroflexi bacterium]|nr:hypothetical protein [Chloroflexota bacterium]